MHLSAGEMVWLAGFAVGSAVRAWHVRGYRRGQAAAGRQTASDTVLVTLAGLGMFVPFVHVFSPWLDFAGYASPGWRVWAGGVLFAAAVWLLWRSHADLGRNWSPRLEVRHEHALVTTGVYGRVRHPMYAAHWLWALAQAVLIPNWVAGPAFVVLFVPLCLVRVPREERMLAERFGEAYRDYAARTGRLFPRC